MSDTAHTGRIGPNAVIRLAEALDALESKAVTKKLFAAAKKDALFMHCLPAHRGEEVSTEVIDGSQSVVWEEAENRLHTQKALMEFLMLGRVQADSAHRAG